MYEVKLKKRQRKPKNTPTQITKIKDLESNINYIFLLNYVHNISDEIGDEKNYPWAKLHGQAWIIIFVLNLYAIHIKYIL